MRWKAASAPRRRSSRPASSAVTCAASCCSLRASGAAEPIAPALVQAASACACSASRRGVSSRFCAMARRFASQASLLRAACAVHSSRRRVHALGLRLPSGCSSAPRLAASASSPRRSSLRASSCAVSSSMVRVSSDGFCLRCARLGFQLGQLAFGLAQLALQRQRAFAGRFAAGHRRVVEALALRRQEVGVRIARRPAAAPRSGSSTR